MKIMIYYPKEIYYCYSLHSRLEINQKINNNTNYNYRIQSNHYIQNNYEVSYYEKNYKESYEENHQKKIIDLSLLFTLLTNGNSQALHDRREFIQGLYINELKIKGEHTVNLETINCFELVSIDSVCSFDFSKYNLQDIVLIEIIAIMKFPHMEDSFNKRFWVDSKGNTNLTNEIVDK